MAYIPRGRGGGGDRGGRGGGMRGAPRGGGRGGRGQLSTFNTRANPVALDIIVRHARPCRRYMEITNTWQVDSATVEGEVVDEVDLVVAEAVVHLEGVERREEDAVEQREAQRQL